jgi:protein involved in polysaccharide export with SLBB domain
MKMKEMRTVAFAIIVLAVGSRPAQIDISKLRALKKSGALSGSEFNQFVNKMYRPLAEEISEGEMAEGLDAGALMQPFTEIDRSIEETEYMVGANDELTIYVWGSVNEVITARVDNEGSLIIPSIGTVKIGGMLLVDAKKVVREKLLDVYRESDISIVLSQIRRFKAYVLGEVINPGAYAVNGATRVSDIIEVAGGLACIDTCRLRDIEITNETFPARSADLALFYHNNDISGNPYLSEGDRVFVRPRKEIVSVSGEINYPGVYDFVEGDNLGTLIQIAGRVTRNADSARIVLTRFHDDGEQLDQVILGFADSAYALQKDDRVLVCRLSEYRVHRNVFVDGEVKYPGRYPMRKDQTRLREVIDLAGGFTDEASLQQSVLYRRYQKQKREEDFEVLDGMPMASLNPLEKGYLKAKYMGKDGIFSLNFADLYDGGGNVDNITLMNGDSVVIARRSMTVEVSGAVITPGLVQYKAGADLRYYIEKANGYNTRAKRIQTVIIRSNSGAWLSPRDAGEVREGDIILVPEKEYKEFFKVARDVLVILSSIAAVITAYIAVTAAMN